MRGEIAKVCLFEMKIESVARMSEATSGANVAFPDVAFAHPGYKVLGSVLLEV